MDVRLFFWVTCRCPVLSKAALLYSRHFWYGKSREEISAISENYLVYSFLLIIFLKAKAACICVFATLSNINGGEFFQKFFAEKPFGEKHPN